MRIKNFGTFEVTGAAGPGGHQPVDGKELFIPPHQGLQLPAGQAMLQDVERPASGGALSRRPDPGASAVPKKLYYRIGEACSARHPALRPAVLGDRVPVLPRKSKAGQRVYTEEELGVIRRIKELLYEEGYTIAGAKKKLDSELAGEDGSGEPEWPKRPPAPRAADPPSPAASALLPRRGHPASLTGRRGSR